MSLSKDKNELVLIDSDSEYENDTNKPNKRLKLDRTPHLTNKEFSIKPFKEVSSEEEDDSKDKDEEDDDDDDIKAINDDDTKSNYDFDAKNGLSMPSISILPGAEQNNSENESTSDSDLEPTMIQDDIPPEVIVETRKQLKAMGSMTFLETYLPTTASVEDIIQLIFKLGFVPRGLPTFDGSNILEYIRILNQAMIKVASIRNRRDDVTTIEDALRLIKSSSKILVITGAGISTSLGIPDFRSSKGFYSMVQHLGLSDPQEVFDLDIFNTDPSLFYSIAHMILPPEHMYSPLHSFIKVLQDKEKLLRNYTQNIDNLESYAGIDKDRLIQCHGSFATATCVTCGHQVDGESIFPQIREQEIPYCPECTKRKNSILKKDDDHYFEESFGVYKPDITFFGEPLPKSFHDQIRDDILDCDLLISIGTSLKVAPVADIVDKIPENIPQILINRDPINHCNFDVSLLGYCDDVASYVSSKLGESWRLPHEKFKQIVGENDDNLTVEVVDEFLREYKILNKTNNKDPEQIIEKELTEIKNDKEEPLVENEAVRAKSS